MSKFPDKRHGKNLHYQIIDASSSAFSVFFTQCPSFLSFQRLMQEKLGLSNVTNVFGVKNIPTDNHIRNLLDPVSPDTLTPVFEHCFDALAESGHLESFRVSLTSDTRDLLIALDGTEYHSSEDISCINCSVRTRDGVRRYMHSMVTPTVVRPGKNTVISLPPEFITPQDGAIKQDCEQNASKRWIKKHGKSYVSKHVTILGDDLYCHEPMCKTFRQAGFNFILVCKPESHKTLYEWINGITRKKTKTVWSGKYHQVTTYRYVEGVPLRDAQNSLLVNYVEVTVTRREDGKRLYHNAFVTNHPVNEDTVEAIVLAGRTRWKIENENNNTLKTAGYHLEHNFGHGKNNLSSLLATMNILSFLFHTMLELMNKKYQLLRERLGRRDALFDGIRTLLIYFLFKNFDNLMDFMLKKPDDPEILKVPV
jgi:hypothetical protein